MNSEAIADVAEALLAASLPIDPDTMNSAAKRVIAFYKNASETLSLPEEEVASRFEELWSAWFINGEDASAELRDVVREAVSTNPEMERLSGEYFNLEDKLETKSFMSRPYAVALIGCSPLIRTLVVEQKLGLDRMKAILNVPNVTFKSIDDVLSGIGIKPPFGSKDIRDIYVFDNKLVPSYYGDASPDEAATTLRGLVSSVPRARALWENVIELMLIGFAPYLFMLYFELLTLERVDRFPGKAIYECHPRSNEVTSLWTDMYHTGQQCPYLNNSKSVHSLDEVWAENKKLSSVTKNGAFILADIFDIMGELPYASRRSVARAIRCYLVLMANKTQVAMPLPDPTSANIARFVEEVSNQNSRTKGVLEQRLVDFLTMCMYEYVDWGASGLGSSVNESNASGRKYGDVEYLNLNNRINIHAYEAHGGHLRDEYITSHVNSLATTVRYHQEIAREHGENYKREIEIVYVAHDISRLSHYKNGHTEKIDDIPFVFRFITFHDLVNEAGGIGAVCERTDLFSELIHSRISRLPDTHLLKKRYQSIIAE